MENGDQHFEQGPCFSPPEDGCMIQPTCLSDFSVLYSFRPLLSLIGYLQANTRGIYAQARFRTALPLGQH